MSLRESIEDRVGPELASALEARGFERLTPVQEAVLAPEIEGRDLRISSQTGSGKTVAIGLALRQSLAATDDDPSDGNAKGVDQRARPRAIVVVPTRELAKQVQEELSWLYAGLETRIAVVTGGGGYRDELRAFRAKPAVVVGTPGRLLDHLKRGSIDASAVGTFVLDEADRMLDMGFREDIEAIFGHAPSERRTHLVSATFPREVKSLADRIQRDPANVEGTPLGTANQDIEHLIHLVDQRERLAAIVNLLLEDAGGQTLIFARTRADVAELTGLLQDAGFSIAMLSGEMEQNERNRALAAFKRGAADALVATDVAARGIDVTDVSRVIHADPPTDSDAYTHRSGRTGRAGKKGLSSILVTPRELARTTALLARAKVRWRFEPLPTAESLRDARDAKLLERLSADFVEGDTIDERSLAVAERILGSAEPARAVGRLVQAALKLQAEPREVTPIAPPQERERRDRAPVREGYVRFRVSWGTAYGAEVRRLVAMLCRRGHIEGRDIGAINLGRTSSVVEIAARAADAFERATAKPDPRDPRIQIRRWSDEAPAKAPEPPPSRAAKKERPSVREVPPAPVSSLDFPDDDGPSDDPPKPERESVREVAPPDRPSRAASKKERASVRNLDAEAPDTEPAPSPPSSKRVAADRPSRAASKKERVSVRDVDAEVHDTKPAPARPSPQKKKKTKAEAPPFTPREAVIRRAPAEKGPVATGRDDQPSRGDRPRAHGGGPGARGREDRPRDRSGYPDAKGQDRTRDDRRGRGDRAGHPEPKGGEHRPHANGGGPGATAREDRPRDRGGYPSPKGAREDRPRDRSGPPPRGGGGAKPWKKAGPRHDGPPPWERRGGHAPPKRRGPR